MRRGVITGAFLVDGTGKPGRRADLLLEGDRVAAVERPGALASAEAGWRVEASGRVVCPGFIDLHSHGDLVLALRDEATRRPLLEGRIAQGITTEVVGNCGLGVAPVDGRREAALRGVVAWMTPAEFPWPWGDVGEYLDQIERIGVPVNVATLVAHGAIRVAEAGLERSLPRADSIESMTRALARALDQGAFGMSLGLIYPPGSFTPTEEILPLARCLGRRRALLTAHIRGSSETLLEAVKEILSLGRGTGTRIHHSHSEAVGAAHWSKIPQVLEMEGRAREEGIAATYDMFPYTAAATTMVAIYPPWALEGGVAALLRRLAEPATRRRIREDVERIAPEWPPWTEEGWAHNLVRAVGWEKITVGTVGSEAGRWAEGLDLEALGRRAGSAPFDAISDLLIREEGRVSQIIHEVSGEPGRDEGLVALLGDPHGAVCTDANDTGRGLPHPAAYGTYPSVLGRYVRERKVLRMEEAIRKMTSYPASILGLADRGAIRPGAAADLVLFDPERIGSRATYREPRRPAEGIDLVMVNGQPIVEAGRLLPANPGVVLRS